MKEYTPKLRAEYMAKFDKLKKSLIMAPKTWLITGVAGFIGSNLLEALLKLNQNVVGIDNFSTGSRTNLELVQSSVSSLQWNNFSFFEGDIRSADDCRRACTAGFGEKTIDIVLHEAALGSVPRSIEDPILTNSNNIDGFLNILVACRDANVKRFVYAASSSTYGDHPGLPKVEDKIGKPLSPYAVTKYVNELYADVFSSTYGMECIGLRYFNVFGPRQDPNGAYAAVIPRWIAALLKGMPVYINGDGETSRDFCFIENVVQANILAGLVESGNATNQVYNIAVGDRTTLNELYYILRDLLSYEQSGLVNKQPEYRDFRPGDVRHSLADIDKAKRLLGYEPTHRVKDGLSIAMDWYKTAHKQ